MFPLERSKKSEGCHAGTERRRTGYARLFPGRSKIAAWQAILIFDFQFSICDYRCCATSRTDRFSYYRDYNAKRADFSNAVRKLSGRFRRRERLFH